MSSCHTCCREYDLRAYSVMFLVKEGPVRRTRLLNVLVAVLLVAGLCVALAATALLATTVRSTAALPADGSNLLLGNPTNALHNSSSSPDNYLMDSGYYTLSYNRDRGEPNWVSWYVGSSSLGSTPRKDDFRADSTLPAGWYQVQGTSYSGSGFD